jgi:hypothetical protein
VSESEESVDTPEEQVSFKLLVDLAHELAHSQRTVRYLEERAAALREEMLLAMKSFAPTLHGIRLKNGDAVRKSHTTSQSKVDPTKLRARLADAPDYITTVEVVDADRLKADYGAIWRELANPKTRENITVTLAKEKTA